MAGGAIVACAWFGSVDCRVAGKMENWASLPEGMVM
jgi:hypothetical protein